MPQKTVLFCGPIDSPINSGRYMIAGLEQNSYRVVAYDYRSHENHELDLTRILADEKPDYLFVLKGEKLSRELIHRFQQAGCVTILWITMIAPEEDVAALIQGYDFIVTNVEFYVDYFKQQGVKHITWIHQGFAPDFFGINRPGPAEVDHYYADVAMIGSMGDRIYRKRCHLLRRLRGNGIDIKWWGPRLARQWRNLDFYLTGVHKAWMGREVYMKNFADVIRHTKIFIGQDADVTVPGKYLSNRVFAVVGCGGFYLGRKNPGLSSVFTVGKELETFDSEAEAVDKIRFYLEHENERKKIALAGQQKVLNQYTYKHQIGKIFNWVNQQL
ncbi:MAG: glycosyltransferase [Desulfosudaceae bacterium]